MLTPRSPSIRLASPGLPAGLYRLESAVSLLEPGRNHPAGLAATTQGTIIEIATS
jgi:hypothetical protein